MPETELTEFGGSIIRSDIPQYQIRSPKAIYAQNVAYVSGSVGTRLGHTSMYALTDGAITAMKSWFFTFFSVQVSVIAYYAPSVGVRLINQVDSTLATVIAVTGAAGAVLLPTSLRLYVAFYNSTGRIGFAGGQVYGWNVGADPLFPSPLTNAITAAETTAGVITAGTHRLAYLCTSRNGAVLALCPVTGGGAFSPFSFTASGGKNIQMTITGAIPSYMAGAIIQAVMTTAANPNQYFTVPGATTHVPTNPTVLSFSISDDDLAATGQDVTQYQNIIASSGATPPFFPSAIFAYSNRLGYVTIDQTGVPVVIMSDQNNFQFATFDQHAIYLEGQQQTVQGFSIGGTCYLAATSGIYKTEDNGDVPVAWTPPQRVDGSIGILSSTCLLENVALGYALIASEQGFYVFRGGTFPPLPLSYLQYDDWRRVNWSAATQVQIGDDQINKKFIVAAPVNTKVAASAVITGGFEITTTNDPHLYVPGISLTVTGVNVSVTVGTVTASNKFTVTVSGHGSPTVGGLISPATATHQFTWDYTDGAEPNTVKYSMNAFSAYRMAALATIRNLTTLLNEIWYAPAANGPLIRQNNGSEASPYRDVDMSSAAATIDSPYEFPLIPDPLQAGQTMHNYHGAHLMLQGEGSNAFTMLAKGLNGTATTGVEVVPAKSPLSLTLNPPNETLVKWRLMSERQSLRIGTNAVDAHWLISLLRLYYTESFAQRS